MAKAREFAEASLAHFIGNHMERTYRRGDALEKRRSLIVEWARFIELDKTNIDDTEVRQTSA